MPGVHAGPEMWQSLDGPWLVLNTMTTSKAAATDDKE